MTAIGRAFVAVEPPGEVLDAVQSAVRRTAGSGDGLRWTSRPQWHVTLQFLGRLDDADLVVAALRAGLHGVRPPTVRLGGGGAFPTPSRGTVLWLGVTTGADPLSGLAARVAAATAPLGFAAERAPFRPHLTLARARRERDLRPLVDALGDASLGPSWPVDEVVLLSSETRPEGARYTEIERLRL